MSSDTPDADALVHAARDIARHIASMAEELSHLRHNSGGESQTLIERQVHKLQDQVLLLSTVVRDIEQATHAPAS